MTAEQQIHSYTQLFQNHPRLYGQNIEAVFAALVTVKTDIFAQLERARERIDQLETVERDLMAELERTQSDYRERDAELQRSLARIAAMEASNFWKLRRAWIKGQKLLRRDWKDPIHS
jgi:chromosome segregation ATPase